MEELASLRVLAEGIKFTLFFALGSQLSLEAFGFFLLFSLSFFLGIVGVPLVLFSPMALFFLHLFFHFLCLCLHVFLHLLTFLLFLLLLCLFSSFHFSGFALPLDDLGGESVNDGWIIDTGCYIVFEFFGVSLTIEVGIEENSEISE